MARDSEGNNVPLGVDEGIDEILEGDMARDLLPAVLAIFGVELGPETIEEFVATLVEMGHDPDAVAKFVRTVMHEAVEISVDMADPGDYIGRQDMAEALGQEGNN